MLIAGSLIALALFGAPCMPDTEPHGRLACADLRDADLAQADLVGADLRGTTLAGADLTQADLRDADLRGADLTGATLTQANLTGADLRGATLAGTSAVQASGLRTIRVDVVGPGAYVQVGYLLLGPALAFALLWGRRRSPRRLAGVVLAVAGLYLLCTGALRGFAAAVTGWLWAVHPGPIAADPVAQVGFGAVVLVVAAFLLYAPRRPPEPLARLAVGRPTPGRPVPAFGPRTRGLLALAAVLGLLDLVAVVVLWLLDALPATGPWGSALGHLVVAGTGTLFLVRGARPPADQGVNPATLSGFVLAEPAYVWLSGASASGRPAHRAVPWESLEHVHILHTLDSTRGDTVLVTVRPPGAREPVEYPNELPVSPAQAARLREILPKEKLTETARTPD